MKILHFILLAFVVTSVAFSVDPAYSDTHNRSSEELVADFESFAQVEWLQILKDIQTGYEHSEELMGATKVPMTRKQIYIVVWIKEKPDSYVADVIRSDSLKYPVKGIIKFNVPVERGTLMLKGPRRHCRNKPLKECLDAGGKITKRGLFNPMGGQITVSQPTEVLLSYIQDGSEWKRESQDSVLKIISTMPSVSSLQ